MGLPRTVPAFVGTFGLMFCAGALGQDSIPATPIMTPAQAQDHAQKQVVADDAPRKVYDEKADAKEQIAAALVRAKKENKRVLVQWGGNWCGWCIRLEKLYRADKDIRKTLQYEYETVFVDAGRPAGKNIDLAKSYGADLAKHGFPFLTILDADGKALVNQESESLEVKDAKGKSAGLDAGHDSKAVLKLLTDHQATYVKAQSLLDSAVRAAKKDHKLVFLHFGAPWCGWCHRLEDWMAKPEPAAVLSKHFVDCKIDVDRTVGGEDVQKKYTGKAETGIPVFFFLDGDGKVVASSIGPDGNIGYPAGDEEGPHFRSMLAAAKVSEGEIKTLLDTARLKPATK